MAVSNEARLLCDAMLGRLARDLRLLGHDVAYAEPTASDEAVLARARLEGRILLTRDRALATRAGDLGLLLSGPHGTELDEAASLLGLTPARHAFLTRCTECGAKLVPATLPDPQVPADVATAWACSACCHRYWEGTHVADMRRRLARHLPSDE